MVRCLSWIFSSLASERLASIHLLQSLQALPGTWNHSCCWSKNTLLLTKSSIWLAFIPNNTSIVMTIDSCLDITNIPFCLPLEESKDSLRLKQDQRKLLLLYHAATCNNAESSSCCTVPHCVASKRLFQHILICTDPMVRHDDSDPSCKDCPVPGCKRSRSIWRHYRKCAIEDCKLCSVAPARPRLLVSRTNKKMERPPLSPRKATESLRQILWFMT
jgi:hypothetical protein